MSACFTACLAACLTVLATGRVGLVAPGSPAWPPRLLLAPGIPPAAPAPGVDAARSLLPALPPPEEGLLPLRPLEDGGWPPEDAEDDPEDPGMPPGRLTDVPPAPPEVCTLELLQAASTDAASAAAPSGSKTLGKDATII